MMSRLKEDLERFFKQAKEDFDKPLEVKSAQLREFMKKVHIKIFKAVVDKEVSNGTEVIFEDVWDIVTISVTAMFWENGRSTMYCSDFSNNEIVSILNYSFGWNYEDAREYYRNRQIIQ